MNSLFPGRQDAWHSVMWVGIGLLGPSLYTALTFGLWLLIAGLFLARDRVAEIGGASAERRMAWVRLALALEALLMALVLPVFILPEWGFALMQILLVPLFAALVVGAVKPLLRTRPPG